MTTQYVIGIDLGTTNSVVSYRLLSDESGAAGILSIPQFVAPQTIEARRSLPSFLYLSTEAESERGLFVLPWETDRGTETGRSDFVTGTAARQLTADHPERTIVAAKSWLCHTRVDRHEPILPWKAPDGVPQVSPVTASQRYLEHMAAAWNAQFPDAPFSAQQVILTVPASFDASARELTREAAILAGLPESMVLLEEPQAATYAWLDAAGDRWRKQVRVGDRLLVVDVGGGTTDLSLVEVTEEQGELSLRRVAVGNHLLIGGDNMDLSLAWYVAQRFSEKGVQLDPWQSVSLWHICRQAKESLLSPEGPETHTISVPGRSSRLIGGMVSIEINRQEAATLLCEGFLPACSLTEKPRRQRASGFQELGLPYESDTAVTRHLAAFLQQNGADRPVTHVVFNGGVFKSDVLRQKLLDQLQAWYPETPPRVLEGSMDLDFAVARGACYYGWAKAHGGVRIRGGTARSYYVGIETAGLAIPGAPRPLRAICVVPQGMEEGTQTDVPSAPVGLIVGEPARFRFFSSAIRRNDTAGTRLDRWSADELVETDSMEATLPAEDADSSEEYVPVTFRPRITEMGMFELWCVHEETGRQWKLEFSVREDADRARI